MRVGTSKSAESREQVCGRDGVGENMSDTVCIWQERYLTEILCPVLGVQRSACVFADRVFCWKRSSCMKLGLVWKAALTEGIFPWARWTC